MLGRLLDDRPRELLPLVPLVGGGPHDVLGEVVDPLLDLLLVLVELEGEVGHGRKLPMGNLRHNPLDVDPPFGSAGRLREGGEGWGDGVEDQLGPGR